jgi:hypothetical protein
VVDGDPTMAYKEWKKRIQEYWIKQTTIELYLPWQNWAELDIYEVKRGVRWFVKRSGSPKRLWCFLGQEDDVTALRGYTAYNSIGLKCHCAAELAVGYTRISRCGSNTLGMIMCGIGTRMASLKLANGWVLRVE